MSITRNMSLCCPEEESSAIKYVPVSNSADGNCLFESIAHGIDYEYSHTKIRQQVYEFYQDFDRDIDYPEGTLEFAIKMGLRYDDFDDNGVRHETAVGEPHVWGNLIDIMVCATLFDLRVVLFNDAGWREVIQPQGEGPFTRIFLLYSGNHFECVEAQK